MTETTVTIVGGGVHGVHLAVCLLESDLVEREELCLIEPAGLLARFRRQCRQCGMVELRSPYVHHVGYDPFSLRDFARSNGRMDELRPSDFGADRPTVSLFFDHAEWVCDRYDLESLVCETRATDIVDEGDRVHIETTAGPVSSRWCVLAVGHGGSYTVPEWAEELPADTPVNHVWDGFDPETVGERDAVGIVGGGITAGQLATRLAQPGRDVTMFVRSPFRVETLEASTDWMHFSSVVEELHDLPPASRKRERLVTNARYDGTMPPYVFRRLRQAIEDGQVTLEETEITVATEAGGTVVVTCENDTACCLDQLVLATGFGSPYDCQLFERLRERAPLQTGYRGAPALDDETLRWLRTDGTRSRVVVSGVGAQQVLGPFARNVIGARRAGRLLLEALEADDFESQLSTPTSSPRAQSVD